MQQGPFFPTVVANDAASGTKAFVNPAGAKAEGGTASYVNFRGGNAVSNLLKATAFKDANGNAPAIPAEALNVVALFEWRKKRQVSVQADDAAARLVTAGAIGADDKSVAGHWPTDPGFTYVGYSWAVTPTVANDAGFGAAIAAKEVAGDSVGDATVDACRLTITYDVP